jgi:hyperosmotically inducible protein
MTNINFISRSKNQTQPTMKKKVLFNIIAASLAICALSACNKSPDQAVSEASISIGTEIDDTVLTTKVKSAMMSDEYVKSFDIQVETFNGSVMLSGFVDTQAQMDRSVEVAKSVLGVINIDNKLSIKEGQKTIGNKIDDAIITTNVKAAMLADSIMKSREVSVVTAKGEVQLSGYVDSETQITHASEVAKAIEGVVTVVNHMSVKK